MKKRIVIIVLMFHFQFFSADLNNAPITVANLTLDQKIGQLFLASCIIDQTENAALVAAKNYQTDVQMVKKLIEKYEIGGVVYLGLGTPAQQIETTKLFAQTSKFPLFFAQDFERGLSQRLYNTLRLPFNMTLGALNDDQLLYAMGAEIARQCKIMGVHINLAPVCDTNNNEKNPIINDRSFGDDPANVARKAIAYMHGLQDNGIIACAKHFPGHGDVTKDSHEELPKVPHGRLRLDAIELHPFVKIIEAGVKMIMSAFLEVPALEPETKRPAALSHSIVTKLLKEELGFGGLVITDGLDMKGVTNFSDAGDIALQALLAGNDLLICSKDIAKSIKSIKEAIMNGTFAQDELDKRVAKILRAKQWAFEQHKKDSQNFGNLAALFTPSAHTLKQQLFSQAVTLAQDPHHAMPGKNHQPIILITFSHNKEQSVFAETLRQYVPIKEFILDSYVSTDEIKSVLQSIENNHLVIVSLLHMERLGSLHFDAKTSEKKLVNDFGITPQTIDSLNALRQSGKKIIIVVFGNPYSLKFFDKSDTFLVAYENDPDAQKAAAQILTGNLTPQGRLPVTYSPK